MGLITACSKLIDAESVCDLSIDFCSCLRYCNDTILFNYSIYICTYVTSIGKIIGDKDQQEHKTFGEPQTTRQPVFG